MEIEQIKQKLTKLLRLGECSAASQGEIDNALRMAHRLMAEHSLTRQDLGDIHATDGGLSNVRFTRRETYSNEPTFTAWESSLAHFVTDFVGTVKFYINQNAPVPLGLGRVATKLTWYGPEDDTAAASELFDELHTSASLMVIMKYGKRWAKGPGRAYVEGFVTGLTEANARARNALTSGDAATSSLMIVVAERQLALVNASRDWLEKSQGIKLSAGRALRSQNGYADARASGQRDGRNYSVNQPTRAKRLE